MSLTCPVCSAPDQTCGHTELAFPPIHAPNERGTRLMASNEGTIVLSQQHVKAGRGKPGYKGRNIDIVNVEGKVVGHGKTETKAEKAARARQRPVVEEIGEKGKK